MSSLKAELQSNDALRQAAALLQLLNAMSGGRDIGTPVTITCQTIIRGSAPPAVKRLGYDVVKAAALTDSDWENTLAGFLNDILPTSPSVEVQIAALEILPLIPPHKLRPLLYPDGKLAGTLTRQLSTSTKEVRAAALAAVGRWLSDTVSSAVLASSPDIKTLSKRWVDSISDALLDPAIAVAAAAFDATRRILINTEEEKLEPGGNLRLMLAQQIAATMLATLPSLLQHAQYLDPQGQVVAAAALVALAEFCIRQPVFPSISTPPVPSEGNLVDWLDDKQEQASGSQDDGSSRLVVIGQIGNHLQGLLSSLHLPLVYEAASGLLSICRLARESKLIGGKLAAAPTWASVAVATLQQLWDKESGSRNASLHAPIVSLVAASIRFLPIQGQLQLAKDVVPMLTGVPSAAARTTCLGHVWAAVVELDLAKSRSSRAGDKGGPAVELRNTLTDPFLVKLISASEAEEGENQDSALREEIVCTLAETLLSHPQGFVQGLRTLEEGEPDSEGLLAVMKHAARVQSAGLLVDWLGAAKIALQGTKACLGWDRDPVGGTYACTAVTDSWLMLLQRSLQAARVLQAAPWAHNDAPAVLEAARLAGSYAGALQELLDQLLMHWQALSGAVQPRALWVAAHHYALAPSMESGWAHLLQALATSLGSHDDDARTRRKQALKAAAAAGQMQPLIPEDGAGVASPIDEAEIRTEAMAVGLVASDRLASLLLYNAAVGPRPGLKDISAALVAILQPLAAANSSVGPQSREHAARVASYLAPLALGPAPSAEAGEAIAVQTEFGAKLLSNPDWPPNEGFPMAGPSGRTLQTTRRGARYWALKAQVQAAIAAASGRSLDEEERIQDPPDAIGILDVMSLITETDDMGKGTVLTGPNDALRLTAWRVLDLQTSRVTFQFEAYNNLSIRMEQVTIRLGLGGPVLPEAKQPPAYKLAVLPAGESVTWRFALRIVGFGRITIQPFVTLPVQISLQPGDTAAMRSEGFHISPAALLRRPAPVPSPDVFFPAWPSLALGAELDGVCRNKGAVGGLQAITALESSTAFARVYFQALPSQGGFHAAYAGDTLGGAKLCIIISAQLLPIGRPLPNYTPGETVPTGHVVFRMSFRSTQEDVVETIREDPGRWIKELFGQTLVYGTNADGLSGPAVAFRIDPSLIPVQRLYISTPKPDEETEGALPNGKHEERMHVRKDPAAIAEEAVRSEWHRIWQQRMGISS